MCLLKQEKLTAKMHTFRIGSSTNDALDWSQLILVMAKCLVRLPVDKFFLDDVLYLLPV